MLAYKSWQTSDTLMQLRYRKVDPPCVHHDIELLLLSPYFNAACIWAFNWATVPPQDAISLEEAASATGEGNREGVNDSTAVAPEGSKGDIGGANKAALAGKSAKLPRLSRRGLSSEAPGQQATGPFLTTRASAESAQAIPR